MPRGIERTKEEVKHILQKVAAAPHGGKMAAIKKLGLQPSVYYTYKARLATKKRKAK